MTLAALALLAALGFADSKTLAVQIHLDRAGFSCSTIDGQWGAKSERALIQEIPVATREQSGVLCFHSRWRPVSPGVSGMQPRDPCRPLERNTGFWTQA